MSSARSALAALAVDRLAGLDVTAAEVVAAAARALDEGIDAPSLARLAGLDHRDQQLLVELFVQVVAELGIELPADATAAQWQLLGEHLGEMVRGDVPLAEAAKTVKALDGRLGRPTALVELRQWLAMLATWIPTDVTPISYCEEQVLQQARAMLAGPWPPVAR
ncbi:hypothetical protein [Amycolatopsis benzoatilytica]|uniref:hypothetical protein n=1 Tax=Amycolatopsis benzoatilytica TaxID=346045 RepID=UPI00036AAA56|nr:hypothetical protein [Amycolatopsis benzoatilytica]